MYCLRPQVILECEIPVQLRERLRFHKNVGTASPFKSLRYLFFGGITGLYLLYSAKRWSKGWNAGFKI